MKTGQQGGDASDVPSDPIQQVDPAAESRNDQNGVDMGSGGYMFEDNGGQFADEQGFKSDEPENFQQF